MSVAEISEERAEIPAATFSQTGEAATCAWCGNRLHAYQPVADPFTACTECWRKRDRYEKLVADKDGIGKYVEAWIDADESVASLKDRPMFAGQVGQSAMVGNDYAVIKGWLPKPPRARSKPRKVAKVSTDSDKPPTAADIKRRRKRRDSESAEADRELANMIRRARSAKVPMSSIADAMGMTRQAVYLFLERVK